jgi:hypothetical protein
VRPAGDREQRRGVTAPRDRASGRRRAG